MPDGLAFLPVAPGVEYRGCKTGDIIGIVKRRALAECKPFAKGPCHHGQPSLLWNADKDFG